MSSAVNGVPSPSILRIEQFCFSTGWLGFSWLSEFSLSALFPSISTQAWSADGLAPTREWSRC
jgi:hypothetical protein